MPALRLIVADHSHVIGENPPEARIDELCRALPLGRRIRRRLDFEFQAHSRAARCRNRRGCREDVVFQISPRSKIDGEYGHGGSPGWANDSSVGPLAGELYIVEDIGLYRRLPDK